MRGSVLQVPLFGEDGSRLKFVSPRQVEESRPFAEQWFAVAGKLRQAQRRGRKPELTALDQKTRDLYDALTTFRRLTYDLSRSGDGRSWSRDEVLGLDEDWSGLEKSLLRQSFALDEKSELAAAIAATGLAMRQLKAAWTQTDAAAQDPARIANRWPWPCGDRRRSSRAAWRTGPSRVPAAATRRDANLAFLAARVAKRAAQVHGVYTTPAKPRTSCRPWNPPRWKSTAIVARSIPGSACNPCSRVPARCSAVTPRPG